MASSGSDKVTLLPEDGEGGRKVYTLHGKQFEVPKKYTVNKVIGYGAYGIVAAATNTETNTKIAIKKCQNVCKSTGDGKRVLREVKLLNFMKHENVLGLSEFFVSPAVGEFKDAYIVTELLDTDLNTVIRSRQKFTDEHLKYFVYQILRGLKYMHSATVMHRDIKPANLLVNVNCDLKIADFGLSKPQEEGADDGQQGEGLTDYVVTRWYRPPELLLMNRHYSEVIDIWSTGCVFVELLNRAPIFPGKDYLDQLGRICGAVQPPAVTDLGFLENPEAVKYLTSLKRATSPPSIAALSASLTDPNAVDFVSRMLTFDPRKRATTHELLRHPYMEALHDPEDEPESEEPFKWELEHKEKIEVEELRREFKLMEPAGL